MFLDMSLGSLWRHKTRSFLTGIGIVLAIAAIVSLGSITAGINQLVDQQLKLASDLIIVTEKGGFDMGNSIPGVSSHIDRELVDELTQIDGVDAAIPQIRAISVKNNLFVVGAPLDSLEYFDLDNVEFIEGDWPDDGEKAVALGYQVAELKGYSVGDEIHVQNDEYVVSGVLEKMSNFIDYGAITSLDSATDTFDFEDQISTIIIEPTDVGESQRIANEIEDSYDNLDAVTGKEAIDKAKEAIDQVSFMTLGIGIIASIVASIGIINTMVMMVFERSGEFGIMKALGARKRTILSLVMQEAVMLGLAGSFLGLIIGYMGTEMINGFSGFPIALVTPELALSSLAYGILLCVFAAAYPAYMAINVNPVEAMREQ